MVLDKERTGRIEKLIGLDDSVRCYAGQCNLTKNYLVLAASIELSYTPQPFELLVVDLSNYSIVKRLVMDI